MNPVLVAAYVRISRKDGDKAESDSIGNQKNLIQRFVNQNPEMELCQTYVDDDYTGTNFDRPEFKKMIEDLKIGKVNCVIVKDLSRFGRDYIDTGRYLEKDFPKMKVRFIAISDNIDSALGKYDMYMPFKNIFNEQYAKDISSKVTAALRTKQKDGAFIGAFASYGYKKDDEKKGKIVVDPYAADIVKRIYDMFLEGKGQLSIAKVLNEENVLCPSEYKKISEEKYHNANRLNKTTYWTYSTIHNILKKEIYTGKMVQHKSNFSRYRVGNTRCVPEEEWIIVSDTHEAIIPEEKWLSVQSLLSKRTRDMGLKQNLSLYAGFLKCGDCERSMSKIDNWKRIRYVCGSYKSYSSKQCTSHRVFEDELNEIILTKINQKLKRVENMVERFENQENKQKTAYDSQRTKQDIAKLRKNMEKKKALKLGLYEDFKNSTITKEDYRDFTDKYQKDIDSFEFQIKNLEEAKENKSEKIHKNPWVIYLKENGQVKELNRAVLDAFINKIVIYEGNRIEIQYKFNDEDFK